jgi:hypothetical protein
MKQVCVSTVMGKRLIGKGMAQHPAIKRVLAKGTLVIIAGTTNGYVAEEILATLGQAEGFSRVGFRRGMTIAPGAESLKAELAGDVVILDGVWQKGQTIFDVAESLVAGDVILKGANAFDARRQAAVQIAHPQGGTITTALAAVVGRRVQLIVPVGLEKRVLEDVNVLAQRCLSLDAQGPRLLPIPGELFTEIDAIKLLTGAEACLIAAGGVYGAEGASWLGLSGSDTQIQAAADLVKFVANEPPCRV